MKLYRYKYILLLVLAGFLFWITSLNDRDFKKEYDQVYIGMPKSEVMVLFRDSEVSVKVLEDCAETWLIWDQGMVFNKFYCFQFRDGRVVSKDFDL